MKKITSVGIKPASSIEEVLGRPEITAMSTEEVKTYLSMLGFTSDLISAAVKRFYKKAN